jgi:hypothetical protein
MHRGEKNPRIAAREVSTRKMQMVMGDRWTRYSAFSICISQMQTGLR